MFGFKRIERNSDICIRVNANQSEPIRKTFWISFVEKCLKINPIEFDSIREFYPNESERIRSKFSIRMNHNQSEHWFIQIMFFQKKMGKSFE